KSPLFPAYNDERLKHAELYKHYTEKYGHPEQSVRKDMQFKPFIVDIQQKRNHLKKINAQCPVENTGKIISCASNGKDNTRCCKKRKLLTGRYRHCRPFCHPTAYDWPTKLLGYLKYSHCRYIAVELRQCHFFKFCFL
uniref:Domain of unknown function DB domain-containing protein n=1 Tax=Romanomermis culicivorax TaxID=13658 RepID=A0A915J7Y1_ROMCU